jgi:hypothetical protein
VLISIGILAIGLTCVLGLIVAGRTSAARSIVYDQIGTVTENARADALTLGLTRLDALTSPTGGDCPEPPLIFDPIGSATGVWPAASGLHPAVLRAGGALSVPDTANAQPRAFPMASYAFESRDDLATVAPSNDDDLPRNQFTAGGRSFHGRTTWLALLTHPFTTPGAPTDTRPSPASRAGRRRAAASTAHAALASAGAAPSGEGRWTRASGQSAGSRARSACSLRRRCARRV